MPQKIQTNYSIEQCIDIMNSCSNSYEFFKQHRVAYHRIPLEVIYKHFNIQDEIKQEMRKYDTWTEFLNGACYYARLAKQLNMRSSFNELNKYRIDAQQNSWVIYRWNFNNCNDVYIGLTKDIRQRIYQELRNGTVHEYLRNTNSKYSVSILERGLYPEDAAEMEKYYIVQAKLDGYHPINKVGGGSLGGSVNYSDSDIITMAQRYHTLTELRKNNALFTLIKRHHIYHQATAHIPRKNRVEITYDMAKEASMQCKRLADYMHKYPSEYATCRLRGWNDILDSLERTYQCANLISEESIHAAFAQCKTRTEFNIRFRSESYAAKKRGIYNDLVKNMPKQSGARKSANTSTAQDHHTGKRITPKRTVESILSEIDSRFNTLSEFRKSSTFYRKVKRWGLYREASDLLKRKQSVT